MKKMLRFAVLFFSLRVHAQADTTKLQADTSIKFIEVSDSTGFGTPDGKLVNKEIGAAGGTIISEDGKVELIFPADALIANTIISIQPATNLAPNGTGKSYQFEPSGIQFKKPVQIIFHYTDEEAEICPPDLMALAIQNATGKWSFIEYENFDSVSKTLKGFIHHFSWASNAYTLKLDAEREEIPVKASTELAIWTVPTLEVSVGEITDANGKPLTTDGNSVEVQVGEPIMEKQFKSNQRFRWYVNGIEMGNNANGYLTVYEERSKLSKLMISRSKYTAPNTLPTTNPVTVRVDIYVSSGRKAYSRVRS